MSNHRHVTITGDSLRAVQAALDEAIYRYHGHEELTDQEEELLDEWRRIASALEKLSHAPVLWHLISDATANKSAIRNGENELRWLGDPSLRGDQI